MAVKKTLYRLGVFGACYVATCTFPPALGVVGLLSNPEAQEFLGETCKAIGSVIAGNVANELGDATTGHPGVSLKNHDLIKAVGKAIAAIITDKAVPEFKHDRKTRHHLLKIAKITPDKWVSLWSRWLNEETKESKRYPEIGEGKLPDILIPKDDKILALEDWEDIFARLNMEACPGGGFQFPDGVSAKVSQLLHDEFPKAFRETLKEDFAEDGKAFAGLMLDLLTGLRRDIARLKKQQKKQQNTQFASVLSQLLQLKNDSEASQAYQILEFAKIKQHFDDLKRKLKGSEEQQRETLRDISASLESSYGSIREILQSIPRQLEELQAGIDQANQGIENIQGGVDLINQKIDEIITLFKSPKIKPRPEIFGDKKPVNFEEVSQQILQRLQAIGYDKYIVQFAHTALPNDAILEDEFFLSQLSILIQILRYQKCSDKFINLLKNKTSQREPDNLPQRLESYLLVTVESHKSSEHERFTVQAWFVEDNSLIEKYGDSAFQRLLDPVNCTQAEIKQWLNKAYSKSIKLRQESMKKYRKESGKVKRYNLTVEIFLPKELLDIKVDHWEIELENDTSEGDFCWGLEYGLRVRSVERLNIDYLVDQVFDTWCQKWEKVRKILDLDNSLESFNTLEDIHSLKFNELCDQLRQKVGLKLTCPTASEQFQVLVKAMLQAATPIALWPRCPDANSNYAERINQLLTCRPLRQLTESVQELRYESRQRGNGPDHLGYHLGFLWEDPSRLPPLGNNNELMQPGE